jgi:hypothetical protein
MSLKLFVVNHFVFFGSGHSRALWSLSGLGHLLFYLYRLLNRVAEGKFFVRRSSDCCRKSALAFVMIFCYIGLKAETKACTLKA